MRKTIVTLCMCSFFIITFASCFENSGYECEDDDKICIQRCLAKCGAINTYCTRQCSESTDNQIKDNNFFDDDDDDDWW